MIVGASRALLACTYDQAHSGTHVCLTQVPCSKQPGLRTKPGMRPLSYGWFLASTSQLKPWWQVSAARQPPPNTIRAIVDRNPTCAKP